MNAFAKGLGFLSLATLSFTVPASAGTVIEHGNLEYGGTETAPMMILAASVKAKDVASENAVKADGLEITGAFARATLPGAPVGGGFVVITNNSDDDDRLIAASSKAAGMMQLHNMRMEGDVMKMYRMADGVPVPAHSTVTLEPGGMHIMFMELAGPLEEGSTVDVDLTFEKAGSITVPFEVKGIAAGRMHMDNMDQNDSASDDAE